MVAVVVGAERKRKKARSRRREAEGREEKHAMPPRVAIRRINDSALAATSRSRSTASRQRPAFVIFRSRVTSHRRDWTGLGSEPGYRFINQRSFRFTPQSTFRGEPWPVAGDRCPRSLKQAFAAPIRRERNGARDLIFRVHSERRILEYFWFWTEKNVPVIRAFVYVTRS